MNHKVNLKVSQIQILITTLFPNLIGAAIIIIYYLFFNLSRPINQENFQLPVILTTLVFILNVVVNHKKRARWKKLALKKLENKIQSHEIVELKKKTLESTYSIMISTLLTWLAAGIAIPIGFILQGMSLKEGLQLFVHIFIIGGSFSTVITFYLNDMKIRKTIQNLFPGDDFHDIENTKNIRFYVRMMIAFWVGGIFPVILSVYFSYQYFERIDSALIYENLTFKYQVLMGFSIVLSLVMSFFSSFYFRRQIGRPLILLEKSMNEVKAGKFNMRLGVDQKDEIGNVFASFNHMTQGLKEREQIKDIFGKFVSNHVRDVILEGKIDLGGEKKNASILFSDIRNFTSLSEKLTPSEVVDLLNSYFNEMIHPILTHQGILDKFIGDALMAVYGVPKEDPEHALNAVKTALVMIEKLQAFNEIRKISNESPIAIGIGINTGEVISGNIGSSERMEYTVIGDHVNIASRLEGLTKDYQTPLIISETTYDLVKDRYGEKFKLLGDAFVKGREKSIKIYGLIF